MALEFSPEIRLGDILTIISFVGVGFAAYYKMKGRIDIQAVKFEYMEKDIEKFHGLDKEIEQIEKEQSTINGRLNLIQFQMGIDPNGEYDKLGHKSG